MRLRVSILVRILVVRSCGSEFADYKHHHKRVYGKKSVVLNDDESRSVPIPKDFAHLMICKFMKLTLNSFSVEVMHSSKCQNIH